MSKAAGRVMNRSHYVARRIDHLDRLIVAELTKNGRMTVRDLAARINLSSPSTAERIRKLEDCGAIAGYTIATEPKSFGLGVKAHVTMRAMAGEIKRVSQLLADAPEIVEADHVTGSDCFVAKAVVRDVEELEALVNRFTPYCSTDTAIVQSSPVTRRLPKI